MKDLEEQEFRKRLEEEEEEVQSRLREARERELAPLLDLGETSRRAGKESSEEASEEEEEGEPSEVVLSEEQMQRLQELKNVYRRLRKEAPSDEVEAEKKKVKKQIAQLLGRRRKKKKKAHLKEARQKTGAEAEGSLEILKTEERIEEEKRKERIRKVLQTQRGDASSRLAQVMEGRGVAEYKAPQETFEEWMKLPVDYCGRLLLETRDTSAVKTGRMDAWKPPMMLRKSTGAREESLCMFLMVEARGPAFLVYVCPDDKPRKKKWSLAALCRKKTSKHVPPEEPKNWKYLCSFVLDNTGEASEVSMTNEQSGAPYKAIRISARMIAPGGESPPTSKVESPDEGSAFSKAQLALRSSAFFSGVVSADTEAETLEWLVVMNGRKAFARYLSACKDHSQQPLEPVAASLFNLGPREIVLQGVPFHKEIDTAIFTSINLPYLDALYCGWREMDTKGLVTCLQHVPRAVRKLDVSANKLGSSVLKVMADFCPKLGISQLFLAENYLAAEDVAGARGIANMVASADPLLLDLRRVDITDEACRAIAAELRNIDQPSLVPKTVSVGENSISTKGLKVLATAIAKTLPRFKVLCLPNIPQLTQGTLSEVLKEVPLMRPTQLSTGSPACPFRSLDESELPERCLSLPAVLSGRLFVETQATAADWYAPQAGTDPFLAFFELRGSALLRYEVPPRSTFSVSKKSKRLSGSPLGTLSRSFGTGLCGIMVSSVSLVDAKIRVAGKKITSMQSISKTEVEVWMLEAESQEFLNEWFRVLTIRRVGVECNTIARTTKEALHPGVGQYCTSCFRTHLDLGGQPLGLGQLTRVFGGVCEDFRLKSVDMSSMALDANVLKRLPRTAFALVELQELDLSFNSISINAALGDLVEFCGSAKICARLVLDGNPLGDSEEVALFVLRLIEHRIQRLCLNACGLGGSFAAALCKRVTEESRQFPTLTALELQGNAIPEEGMKAMLDGLIPRCPALKEVCLFGNGFETIGRFQRAVQVNFTKTFYETPRKCAPLKRLVTKKPKALRPPTEAKSGGEAAKPKSPDEYAMAQKEALEFLKNQDATGARIGSTPRTVGT
ncbi:hypothetical protein cyc_04131 [Cyclospora cayetanensis]|uniref:Leucine rich repeat-containing protein n=1 Tax=Cyclospora cayetanensis TaxID=88456 RepID=A0A1D3D251_9EIME|nr:hypothetical protein cyc_04131 [Cyclospora cayetanensis]